MNDIKRVFTHGVKYIKKVWRLSKSLATQTHYYTVFYFLDYLYCYIRYGCYVEWYFNYFYSLSTAVRNTTLTHNRFKQIYNKYNDKDKWVIFENKALFNQYYKKYQNHKSLYVKECSLQEFNQFINTFPMFIIKPVGAMQGIGIRKYVVNDSIIIEDLFNDLKNEDVIIEEIVKSHSKLIFNNKSLNTIRVYTILDSNNHVHIVTTILRCGVGETIVDNYHAGGVLYNVDVETGIITHRGYTSSKGMIYHPGSDIQMVGYKIPMWSEMKDYVSQLALTIPECRIIGWDIAITDKGLDVIEGNHNPDHELLELFTKGGMIPRIMSILQS